MNTINNATDIEEKIHSKTDVAIAGATQVSAEVGGLAFKDMAQVMEFAKLMSVSRQAVPKHLREQPGACLAVSLQALNWRMDPFAVANKSYAVNDRIAYEAQLIQAVIEQRAPIKGRIKGSYEGEGAKRVCVLKVVSAEDGEEIVYRSPEIGQIKVKNSPLWQADPDQQLWYYAARAMCRRHFPDVLLGVYAKDEIQESEGMKDVTPEPSKFAQKAMEARKAAVEDPVEAEEVTPDVDQTDVAEAIRQQAAADHAQGKERDDCPYDKGTPSAQVWLETWDHMEAAV